MSKLLTFEELWTLAVRVAFKCNGLCYHPCCDVWTTRSSKLKRASHRDSVQWRKVILNLGHSCEEKKQALLSKMSQENWRIPALLNESCKLQKKHCLQGVSLFKRCNQKPALKRLETGQITDLHFATIPDHSYYEEPSYNHPLSSLSAQDSKPLIIPFEKHPQNSSLTVVQGFEEHIDELRQSLKQDILNSVKDVVIESVQKIMDKQSQSEFLSKEILRQVNSHGLHTGQQYDDVKSDIGK